MSLDFKVLGTSSYGTPTHIYEANINLADVKGGSIPLFVVPINSSITACSCYLEEETDGEIGFDIGTYYVNDPDDTGIGKLGPAIGVDWLYLASTCLVKSTTNVKVPFSRSNNTKSGYFDLKTTGVTSSQVAVAIVASPTITTAATKGRLKVKLVVIPL